MKPADYYDARDDDDDWWTGDPPLSYVLWALAFAVVFGLVFLGILPGAVK